MPESGATAPIAASTVAMLRDADRGVEVCMLRRPSRSSFAPGAYVFPGGAVDPDDGPAWSDAAFRAAGVREVLEETGVLIGRDARGEEVTAPDAIRVDAARARLLAGAALEAALRDAGLMAAPERLVYAARFITPVSEPKRFDARFFLIRSPHQQEPSFRPGEAVEGGWYRPEAMLDHEFPTLFPPTRVMCDAFSRHGSVDAIIAALGAEPIEVTSITPEVVARWMAIPRRPAADDA